MSGHNNNKNNESSFWEDLGMFALKTAALTGAVIGGISFGLPAIGFAAAGVTASSFAAKYQSAFLGGTVERGSAFSHLQRAGVIGLDSNAKCAIVACCAAASGAYTVLSSMKKENSEARESSVDESDDSEENDDLEILEKDNQNIDFNVLSPREKAIEILKRYKSYSSNPIAFGK